MTDHDRWCDRKSTKTKPPFVLWQKLNVEGSKPILTVSWCEELSNIGTEYWLAAATCTSVYLFAASTADENQISVLPVWELIRKIDVQKKGRINTLSWSSFFGVRKLLVGGHKLNLFAINGKQSVPLTIWKAKRYPVSGSVIIDAKLSMDGRLFATAEKSSRLVRVWFTKHGVHGVYSCAHLPHERSVVSISWRPYLTTSAKGDVQMIHGTSTRRALMTLTKGSIVYIWQESDKSEEFRMLLALTFGEQSPVNNFSPSCKLLSSVWVTYRKKEETFEWGDMDNSFNINNDNNNNNIDNGNNNNNNTKGSSAFNNDKKLREYDENKMKNQKKIISKSHGHVVGRKETSVRLGPYAEHFEDTDYIVGLTNENKVKIWVISGIDAQPRCSIGVKPWGTASTRNVMPDSKILAATCFITEAKKLLSMQSTSSTNGISGSHVGKAATSRSMPEPIRLCLILNSKQALSCKAVWLEWDANRPLSVAGQAAYDRGGQTTESRLYDAGHSHDIIAVSTLSNGSCLENAVVSLDCAGIVKTWNVDSLSGVLLSSFDEFKSFKAMAVQLWGGTIRTENGDDCWMTVLIVVNKNYDLIAYVRQNVTLSVSNDNHNGDYDSNNNTWDLLCKTNLADTILSEDSSETLLAPVLDINIIGMIDSLYIGLTNESNGSVMVVHMKVFDRIFKIMPSKNHVFSNSITCASFSKCNAAFTYSRFYVACADNIIYSLTMNEGENEMFRKDIDVNAGNNRTGFQIISFASTSKSSKMALIVKDVARNLFQVEVYDERNSKYEVQSIISIETDTDVKYNAINEKYLQIKWLHRYGHDSFIATNCGTRIDIYSTNGKVIHGDDGDGNEVQKNTLTTSPLEYNLTKIASTDRFDNMCKGFVTKNNGNMFLNFGNHIELYDGLLFYEISNNMKLRSKCLDHILTKKTCIPSYHPDRLMQNVCCDKIKRIRVALTNLLDSIASEEKIDDDDGLEGKFNLNSFQFDDFTTSKKVKVKKKEKKVIAIPNIEDYLGEISNESDFREKTEDATDSFSSFTSTWVVDDDNEVGYIKNEKKNLKELVNTIKSTKALADLLNENEITYLCAFIDAFINIYGSHRYSETDKKKIEVPIGEFVGLDNSARKYLMALKVNDNLFRRKNGGQTEIKNGNNCHKSIETRNLIWASMSKCSNILVSKCIPVSATWEDVRSVGASFWIDNGKSVCALAEKVARQQFLKNDRDPYACLLLYAALGKLKVIAGLFKMKREEKFYNFFMNDFTKDRWKSAALKNGYALMKQHKYELAAAFLLIGGKVFEAARICEKNLGDIQLALFIIRIVESSQTLTSTKYLKPWIENQLLDYSKENKDLFIQCMAYKLLEKESEIIPCIRNAFINVHLQKDRNNSTARGERWLQMSNGLDPTLALVYQHMKEVAIAMEKEKKSSSSTSFFDIDDTYSNSNNNESSIFDSFDFGSNNNKSNNNNNNTINMNSGSMFDSLDFGSSNMNINEEKNVENDEEKQFDNITKQCAQMYANAGMPLLSLELLSETVQNLHEDRIIDVHVYKSVEMCIEKIIGTYLLRYDEEISLGATIDGMVEIDTDSTPARSLNEITEEFIKVVEVLAARFGKGFILQDILSSHVELLSGKGKFVQALLLQSAIHGQMEFNKLPQIIEALSLSIMKILDNGLKLESPINRLHGATILSIARKFASDTLKLKEISSKFKLWKLENIENEINDKMLFDLALTTLSMKIAWSTRHILLLSEIISDDFNNGNIFKNFSTYSQISKLLEEPGAFSYQTKVPYANECILHILYTKALLKLWGDYVVTVGKNRVIDPWIDTTVAHYDTSLSITMRSNDSSDKDDLITKIDRICFTFGTYYNSLMEDSHKMQLFLKKLTAIKKDIILSENVALKTIWTHLNPENEITEYSDMLDGISSPKILSDTETSADEEDNLEQDAEQRNGDTENGNSSTGEINTNTRLEETASTLFNSINNITGNDQKRHNMRNLPFVEIVHTTNISISSFCFDESDSASPYVTVATANGIIETNIQSSLKFRKRNKSRKVLLDRDDLSWMKSRDRFWQEENDMLEREMLDLASKESQNTPTLIQLLDRGRFTVSRQDYFKPNKSEIEERTFESMSSMNAGRSFTVDDLQASCMESHTRFPFYVCGNELGELSLWSFGETNCLAMYSEPGDRSCGINNVHFNGLGDKFVACDTSGIVRLWKFGSNPNCLNSYENIDTELENVKDALFLNSGSVIALGGASSPNDKRINGTFQLWDTLLPPSARKLCSFGQKMDNGSCNALLYLPDEELLICGYGSGKLMAFDIRQRCMLNIDSFGKKSCHKSSVVDVAYSPAHNIFSTASSDGCVKLWDSHTLNLKYTYENIHDSVTNISFHGDHMYTSGTDGRMLMYKC